VLTEAPYNAAYYSFSTPAKTDEMPADPAGYTTRVDYDGVAKDNLAVAVTVPNQSDKETFLYFALDPLLTLVAEGKEITIDSAIVTVPLAADEGANRSVSPDPVKVKACASTDGFVDLDAAAYDDKPATDCNKLNVVAKASTDGKAYTFDVTSLAKTWIDDLNNGIALVPARMSSPFQVVFQKKDTVSIALSYTVVEPTVDPEPTTPPLPPVDTYVPPVNTGNTVTPNIGVQPQPQPQPTVAPRPTVAPPVQRQITPVATNAFSEDNKPSAAFWLAALAGVGLIGAMSLFLGTTEVPVRSGSVQNGVGRALDERRRVGRSGFRTTARPVGSA
jgi:hypothetical protein